MNIVSSPSRTHRTHPADCAQPTPYWTCCWYPWSLTISVLREKATKRHVRRSNQRDGPAGVQCSGWRSGRWEGPRGPPRGSPNARSWLCASACEDMQEWRAWVAKPAPSGGSEGLMGDPPMEPPKASEHPLTTLGRRRQPVGCLFGGSKGLQNGLLSGELDYIHPKKGWCLSQNETLKVTPSGRDAVFSLCLP